MSVVGVIGGSGGVGASSFAAALASAAAPSVLVDADPVSGGIDVLLGIEEHPGARWSGLRVDGGRLDPDLLAAGLPRWGAVRVLAADVAPAAEAVAQVVAAAVGFGRVIIDLPRACPPTYEAVLRSCELRAVVAVAEVRALSAAAAVVRSLPADGRSGVVLRRGAVPTDEAAALLGAPLLGVLPSSERPRSRAVSRVAEGLLDGLDGLAA